MLKYLKLERSYADETTHLNPPHRFVPWVIVDNQPLQDDYQNFAAYVCRAYKGSRRPSACKSLSVEINSSNNENSVAQVSYTSEAKNLTSMAPAQKKPKSPTALSTKRMKMKMEISM
ncbi:gamma-interferon-responsive lysosomal thiol protein-like [Camellia sinensis]|uniref:gamma-interferon-responsive lysosomal thiol protein-like n=1 Tax=Camellia sinensis TaxID=4442 RepID=UPI001036CA40|nr:gamma-interferon-responsive lysosomal thiol protein-like [Camellia sinensis]